MKKWITVILLAIYCVGMFFLGYAGTWAYTEWRNNVNEPNEVADTRLPELLPAMPSVGDYDALIEQLEAGIKDLKAEQAEIIRKQEESETVSIWAFRQALAVHNKEMQRESIGYLFTSEICPSQIERIIVNAREFNKKEKTQ